MNKSTPPIWPKKFLQWFSKEPLQESILGDLEEQFDEDVEKHGKTKAKWKFTWNVIRFCRSGVVKSLGGNLRLNDYGMFNNHLKTSIRSLKKNALFSGINVVGLAISMSVGILMILFLSEIYSFDGFHVQRDKIYRVTTNRKALFQGEVEYFASASPYIADQIEAQIPDVEQMLVLRRNLAADLKTEEKAIAISGYYATASFFDVLSFNLIKGNPQTALENPGSIVLTESTSKKLFGDSDPMGKTVSVGSNQDFRSGIITGVMEDPPINSHLHFEMLVSMKTMENSLVNWRRNFKGSHSYTQCYVYLVLKEGAKIEEIESLMEDMMADYNLRKARMTHSLEPMQAFVTGGAGYQPGPAFSKQKINVMLGLTLIVLLSACFNYTNLSLARALSRSKEISVRKTVGSTRFQVFSQFITEAVLLSLIALIVGLGMFFLIKPEFLNLPNLMDGGRGMFLLEMNFPHIMYGSATKN